MKAQNISRQDYEIGGLEIGPDWQGNVLDTLPLVQMMREVGVRFEGAGRGGMVSQRRNEYSCKDSSSPDILFAVKTCEAYHHTRVPVIKNTWGKYAKHVTFFSDKQDQEIPTVNFPNLVEPKVKTMFGCNKTLSILKHFLEQYPHHDWLVLVDDDTILSVARVRSMISCYRDQLKPVIIGNYNLIPILMVTLC